MNRWTIAIALAALSPGTVAAQVTAEQATAKAHDLYSPPECRPGHGTSEIVVCATDNAKFRLPLRAEKEFSSDIGQHDAVRDYSKDALPRVCGVFRGQRRCNLHDLRTFGYGGGSVPIRALVMLAKKALDPEYELGPPKGYPIDPKEVR